METLIESIKLAVAPEASSEARASGANACRTILAALDAKAGESLVTVAVPSSPLATIVAALRGMPSDQILDLAIARLRAALPPDAVLDPVKSLTFALIPIGKGAQ